MTSEMRLYAYFPRLASDGWTADRGNIYCLLILHATSTGKQSMQSCRAKSRPGEAFRLVPLVQQLQRNRHGFSLLEVARGESIFRGSLWSSRFIGGGCILFPSLPFAQQADVRNNCVNQESLGQVWTMWTKFISL